MKINKKNRFIVGLDLDGTLISDYASIYKENIQSINELHKRFLNKFILVLVSGRSARSMQNVWANFFPNIAPQYHIAFNGSYIVSIGNTFNEYYHSSIVFTKQLFQILNKIFSYSFFLSSKSDRLGIYPNHNDNYFESFKKWLLKNKVLKISGQLNHNYRENGYFQKLLSLEKKGKLTIYVHPEYGNYVEITNGGIDKYLGIVKLSKILNIKQENLIVVGNGPNDYTMLSKIQNSFLIANHSLLNIPPSTIILNKSNNEGFIKEMMKYIDFY